MTQELKRNVEKLDTVSSPGHGNSVLRRGSIYRRRKGIEHLQRVALESPHVALGGFRAFWYVLFDRLDHLGNADWLGEK